MFVCLCVCVCMRVCVLTASLFILRCSHRLLTRRADVFSVENDVFVLTARSAVYGNLPPCTAQPQSQYTWCQFASRFIFTILFSNYRFYFPLCQRPYVRPCSVCIAGSWTRYLPPSWPRTIWLLVGPSMEWEMNSRSKDWPQRPDLYLIYAEVFGGYRRTIQTLYTSVCMTLR